VRDTVERHLPATVEANERLFERFPRFVLSFEGTWRYRLLAEHHPQLFARVRRRVAERRWHAAGAAVEAFDALLPSPESIVRQILYGRRWLRRELSTDSHDLLLPDCFGFPRTLPTLAAHLGLVGFSTQKLRRGPLVRAAYGIPFAFGRWRGADGGEVLAALDPGEYSGRLPADPTRDPEALADARGAAASGAPAIAMRYVGVGDRGGAVPTETAARLESALDTDGPLEIRHGPSEQIYLETTSAERAALAVHDGELLLRQHGTGCYTAKAVLKRWSRRVEALARAAEAAAVAALAAGLAAPRGRLEEAWTLLLAHQMHDDLTGTAIPAAYRYSLGDLGLAANELEEILLDAVGGAAGALDATGSGARLVVLSTVAAPHEELLEVAGLPAAAEAVVDAEGVEREIQRLGGGTALLPVVCRGAELQLLRAGARSAAVRSPAPGVEAGERWLESGRYRLELDEAGALASLVDKRLDRELLSAPAALELLPDRSSKYPAWEILWPDTAGPPRALVDRLRRLDVVERGPLRAALAVERFARGVVVRETWRLAAGGAGELVVADVEIEWRRRATLLKARFPLAARNPTAAYDTGLDAIERPLASATLYEVPAQHWAAIEDASGSFGVALLVDCRHGWDHPDAGTLRSTWIHAPRASFKWRHQATQDFGLHRLRIAVAGLGSGSVAGGRVAALAERFVHRPRAFHVAAEVGVPGAPRRRTLVSLAPPLRLLALKPAEDGERAVLRVSNPTRDAHPLTAASELAGFDELHLATGMEERTGEATELPPRAVAAGGLASCLTAPLCFALAGARGETAALALPWEVRGVSGNGERPGGDGFDGRGHFLPRELLPRQIDDTAVPFDLGHLAEAGHANVAVAGGQLVELPAGTAEAWLLAAAVDGERALELEIDGAPFTVVVPDWRRPLLGESRWRTTLAGRRLEPAELLRRPTAWSCGHLHDRHGADLAVERATLFALRLPVAGARRLRLPVCPALRILAATSSRRPARPLTPADPPFPA